MDFKPNISKIKHRLLLFISVMFIAIMLPSNIVYASDPNWAGMAAVINSTHSNNAAGVDEIPNGVSVSRTGYLAYMVNKETGAPTSDAKAFYAGTNWISGSQWIVKSRHGGLSGSPDMQPAEWGAPWIPPAYKGAPLTSLEPQIKEWFRTQGSDFVNKQFPANHSNFVADTEVLVLETIMNLQFSEPGDKITESDAILEADRQISSYGKKEFCKLAAEYGFPQLYTHCILEELGLFNSQTFEGEYDYAKEQVARELVKLIMAESDTGERKMWGDPVIGTVPNLLAYDKWNTIVFDSYLNNGACHAEKIEYSEAGFEAYSGSGNMTDAEVQNFGVAMMIIHCKDPAQTTCDESLLPDPHDPPEESKGHTTIVKSYREKINGEEKHVDTTSRIDLGTQIIIENEEQYQVIGWRVTDTTNTDITSINWNPPGKKQAEGKAPGSVTIEPTYTCLYVLLEKVKEDPTTEEEYNYLLSESSITRTVWFSDPDYNTLNNMNNPEWIYEHEFWWGSPETPFCEGHGYYKACATHHTGGTCNCTGLCSSGCTEKHHLDTCADTCTTSHGHKTCTTTHYWNCGSDDCLLEPDTAYCSGDPEWVDKTLELTITNTKQNSYPDILATKKGWNAETIKGGLEKRFYGNGQIERTKHGPEEHKEESEITNWDYVCILMRGKDKLTLAEWQNYGDGNNAGNA